MRKTLLLFTLILFAGSFKVHAQDVLSTERKLYNLRMAEKSIFELPYSYEHINLIFMPEIESSRATIAPNYPNREGLPRDMIAIDQAFFYWIETYPSEYDNYYQYLNLFYRDHK